MPMTRINILILAAGHGSPATGYPACLTEIGGTPLLERIVQNAGGFGNASYTYALLEDEVRKFHLDHVVELLTPGAKVVRAPKNTLGSACTALLAAATMSNDDELLIVSANELVDVNLAEIVTGFRNRGLDAGTVSFNSVHPRYSFVRLDEQGDVIEATQQKPISRNATTGVFWFRNTGRFVDAVKQMIRKGASTNGAFYVCPAFNELLLGQAKIGVASIDPSHYHPLKNDREVSAFEQHHMAHAA